MNTGNNNAYGNANGPGRQYYVAPRDQFPQLRSTGSHSLQYQPLPPPSSVQRYSQPHQQQRAFASMAPAPAAQFGGDARLNPNVQRFEPRGHYPDPIARPDSGMSTASFATQLTRPPYMPFEPTPKASPASRPPYLGQQQNSMQRYAGESAESMRGLGAVMSGLSLNSGKGSRQLAIVNEGSEAGNSSRRGSTASSFISGASTPRSLAESIKNGETEDPYDRSLRRFDTPVKNPGPILGPARFKDSKMFSTAAKDAPDIDYAGSSAPQRPRGPPAAPDWLDLAVQGLHTPTLGEAFDSLPFTELCRNVFPSRGGVIRVKDIPYQTTRQEMTAFVGRNAQILRMPEGSPYHAVHIMMERETGKTMDCFIELTTPNEAAWVVRQFADRTKNKRAPKVGDRCVEVVYSSPDEFLQEVFPRAKHVRWSNGVPVVDTSPRQYYPNQLAAGFRGFIDPEELVALQKHAHLSERAPFSAKSVCRVYESMITTLYKYPWFAVQWVTIKERTAIFDTYTALLMTFIKDLRSGNFQGGRLVPTTALLQEFVIAGLTCPGFSEKQKANIVVRLNQNGFSTMVEGRFVSVPLGGCHEFSNIWPFAVLSCIPGTDEHLIKYFAKLFREATISDQTFSLATLKTAEATGRVATPMGQFAINYGVDAASLSLASVAKIEYNEIEKLLKRVCPNAGFGSSSAPVSIAATASGSSKSTDSARSAY